MHERVRTILKWVLAALLVAVILGPLKAMAWTVDSSGEFASLVNRPSGTHFTGGVPGKDPTRAQGLAEFEINCGANDAGRVLGIVLVSLRAPIASNEIFVQPGRRGTLLILGADGVDQERILMPKVELTGQVLQLTSDIIPGQGEPGRKLADLRGIFREILRAKDFVRVTAFSIGEEGHSDAFISFDMPVTGSPEAIASLSGKCN